MKYKVDITPESIKGFGELERVIEASVEFDYEETEVNGYRAYRVTEGNLEIKSETLVEVDASFSHEFGVKYQTELVSDAEYDSSYDITERIWHNEIINDDEEDIEKAKIRVEVDFNGYPKKHQISIILEKQVS